MTYTNIVHEMKGPYIARIIVNRPDVLNAIDYSTAIELKEVLSKINEDGTIRVAVITGAGEKSFIVGADRREIALHGEDRQRARAFEQAGRDAINALEALHIPSVCAINGYAMGMGMQLALACTFRIASHNAKFGLPEINMGFFPSMGATQRLTRLVGEAKAMEMIIGGETIDAAEAFRLGLVHKTILRTEFGTFIDRFADGLAEKKPLAVKLAMDAIKRGREMPLSEGLAYEARLADECSREGRD